MRVTFKAEYTDDEQKINQKFGCVPENAKVVVVVELPSDSQHTSVTEVYERFLRAMGFHK